MTKPIRPVRVKFMDLELDVLGVYVPALLGNYEQPPESPEFEIHDVKLPDGTVVTDLIQTLDDYWSQERIRILNNIGKTEPSNYYSIWQDLESRVLEVIEDQSDDKYED